MNSRCYYFSFLRAISCIAVIILHIAASEGILYQSTLTEAQTFGNTLLYNLMMWAVPCFVMVSGALLLDPGKEIGLRKIFFVYIRRVLFALILCSVLFRIFDMALDREALTVAGVLQGFLNAFTGNGWSHLWYLYLIIGLYLILPFLRIIVKFCTEKELMYFLLLGFFVFSVLPLTKLLGVSSGFYVHVNTVYPVYFLLGYVLSRDMITVSNRLSVVLVIAGTLGISAGTYFGLTGMIQNPTVLTGYSSIFVVILATGVFCLSKHAKGENQAVRKVIFSIDRCSFGIYLIHMVFIRIVLRYMNLDLFVYPIWISFPLTVFLVFTVSYLLVFAAKRFLCTRK